MIKAHHQIIFKLFHHQSQMINNRIIYDLELTSPPPLSNCSKFESYLNFAFNFTSEWTRTTCDTNFFFCYFIDIENYLLNDKYRNAKFIILIIIYDYRRSDHF